MLFLVFSSPEGTLPPQALVWLVLFKPDTSQALFFALALCPA
jgi:hypothetical protein